MIKGNKQDGFTTRNIVRYVQGGQVYFNELELLINSAKQVLHLQVYIFTYDETGRAITAAMAEAVKRGVQVYLLADGYASQDLDEAFEEEMRNAGIYFRRFEPLFKSSDFYFGRRMHHKIAVADHCRALVTGINIDNKYNDMPGVPGWMDIAVYTEGEAAITLSVVCCEMWNGGTRKSKRAVKPSKTMIEEVLQQYANQNAPVRVRRNDWVRKRQQIRASYIQMLNHAQEEVIIMSSYFLPGKTFRRKMAAAVRRGVKIKVVLAGPSDVMLAKYAERFLYDWLLRNKIELYEHRNIVHAKIAVADESMLTIGSFNFNDISIYASIELNLDIKEPIFIKQVRDELHHIIVTDCVPVTYESHNRIHSIWNKFWYRIAFNLVKWMLTLATFYYKQRK